MLIPWKVDVPQDRWPIVNYIIIALAIAAFVCQFLLLYNLARSTSLRGQPPGNDEVNGILNAIRPFVLDGFSLRGLFGHIWLHGGIIHLVGNMLFLWIFGNAVCAKIGNRRYLPIYLGLGIFAGLTHMIFQGGPVIGASGAINGIVGMFLIFFPENTITCYWLFFGFMGREFTIRSFWMILYWLIFDILGAILGGGSTAYFAHLGGFAAGVGLALIMLKMKWVVMEKYEKSLPQLLYERKHPVHNEFVTTFDPLQHEMEQLELLKKARAKSIEESPKQQIKNPEMTDEDFFQNDFIRFLCSCGKKIKVPTKYAGKKGKCPKCKKVIRIPDGPLI